jgi:ribosome biogenesis GTPase / thiamine phosphate phosphatase
LPFSALQRYGWDDRWAALYADVATPETTPGRVVRHDSVAVLCAMPDGVDHVPVRAEPSPLVGDWVVVAGGVVAGILPRTSTLRRRDPHAEAEQQLAANVDVVAVVCGLDRPVKEGRIQRTASLAADAGAVPLVVLTKRDLVADDELDRIVADVSAAAPGLEVVAVSARAASGLDGLRTAAVGRTVVLLGESGAGKSTLVNALVGDDVAATGDVRSGDRKGRHTTTARQLHLLDGGGVLVDTPGIRAVGLWVDEDAVDVSYADLEELAEGCRFRDCGHGVEPGCAVTAAVAGGTLDAERVEAWHDLRREAASAALRADEHARRQSERRFGRMTKEAKARKGRR